MKKLSIFCHVLETFSSVTFADFKNQIFFNWHPGKIVEIFLELIFRIEIDANKVSFLNFLISIKASCVKMHKIINMRTGFKPSKVGPMNPQEKSTQNQIDLFVEKRSSVGLQQLEASLASFSANSKDLSKKEFQNDQFNLFEDATQRI